VATQPDESALWDKSVLEEQYDTARRWVEFSLHCMQEVNPRYKELLWNKDENGKWIYDTVFITANGMNRCRLRWRLLSCSKRAVRRPTM
jgi:hypothetical protein